MNIEDRLDSLESSRINMIQAAENHNSALQSLHSALVSMDKTILLMLERIRMQELEIERLRCELIQCSQIN
jgi:hypothetical protein